MARNPSTPDCAIKRCARAAGKSGLCEKHHRLVPLDMTLSLNTEISVQSHRLAQKHYRKWRRYVQRELDMGTAAPRPTAPQPASYFAAMRAREAFEKGRAATS